MAALLVIVGAGEAGAYDEKVHAILVRRVLPGLVPDAAVAPIDPALPAALRRAIDEYGRRRAEPSLRAAWIRRYPTEERFDAWAEKELLLLSPAASVWGIDRTDVAATTTLELVAMGARQPDSDRRNRDRLAYDASRHELRGEGGGPVAADPAILNMGRLGALSSQGHAHYGFPSVQFSSDPEVLKTDPRRFALATGYPPGPVLGLAPVMAQEHLDLALLAALSDSPSAMSLAWMHTGQALHYLEDVGNPIHTVQVGLYDFFRDAYLAQLWIAIRTGGGYLGHLPRFSHIGIDILTNHHVLSEAYTMRRLLEVEAGGGDAQSRDLVATLGDDAADFQQSSVAALAGLGDHPERGEFGAALTRALVDVSSLDGAAMYRATRAIAQPRLSQPGVRLEDKDATLDPYLRPASPETAAAYRDFFALQRDSFRRVATALRRWIALERAALADAASSPERRAALREAVLDRLIRRQLQLLDEAEARRADLLAHPLAASAPDDHKPVVLGVEIALVALAVAAAALLRRRVRRARRARGEG